MAEDKDRAWLMAGIGPEGGSVKDVTLPGSPSPLVAGLKVIDCDTHFTEPPDNWTSRSPASLKERMPSLQRLGDFDIWMIDGQPMGPIGASVIRKDKNKRIGKISLPNTDDMHEAAWSVKPRLEFMDTFGIWAQICYPNSFLSSAAGMIERVQDPLLREAVIKVANDASAERQAESGERLFAPASLPIWDAKLLIDEARRSVEELGLKSFNLADRPEDHGFPGFLDDYWAPFWEFCSEKKIPVNFHIGTNIDGFDFVWKAFGYETQLAVAATLFSLGNAGTIANFLMSGLFDKYPGLRIVSVESGLGWIPFMLESLEWQMDEMMPTDGAKLERRPTEYFLDHCYSCFWFEEKGPGQYFEKLGVENVLFETDFPHPTSLYPSMNERIEVSLGGISESDRRRVLQDNAAELYQLPI